MGKSVPPEPPVATLHLSLEEWDWLQEKLAEEPKVLPNLRALLKETE